MPSGTKHPRSGAQSRDERGFRRLTIDELIHHDTQPPPQRGRSSGPTASGRGTAGRGTTARVPARVNSNAAPSRGTRAIKCSYCNREFATRDELTAHRMQSHPTSFICQICNTSFFDRGNLNKHIRAVHEKRRPFECDYCSSTFAFSDGLKRHIRMVHLNDRPFPCAHCSLAFKQRAHLLKHVSARHPEMRAGSSSNPNR